MDEKEVKKTRKSPVKDAVKKRATKIQERREPSPQKLKLLVTVVPHGKGAIFMDTIEAHKANMQFMLSGQGTAASEMAQMLGSAPEKDIVLSLINEDFVAETMKSLNEKFKTVRGGNGISLTVSLSSVIGAHLYRFLSDARMGGRRETSEQ